MKALDIMFSHLNPNAGVEFCKKYQKFLTQKMFVFFFTNPTCRCLPVLVIRNSHLFAITSNSHASPVNLEVYQGVLPAVSTATLLETQVSFAVRKPTPPFQRQGPQGFYLKRRIVLQIRTVLVIRNSQSYIIRTLSPLIRRGSR